MSINNIFDTTVESLPEEFAKQGQVTLIANSVSEFRSFMKDANNDPVKAAISVGPMVITEITGYRQLPANGPRRVADEDCKNYPLMAEERFWALEFLIACPGARLGEMVTVTVDGVSTKEFQELTLYSDPAMSRLTDQNPVIYGQQMQANPEVVARLHEFLTNAGWADINNFVGDATQQAPTSERRKRAWRIGLPIPEGMITGNSSVDYTRSLEYRIQHSHQLDSLTVTSSSDDQIAKQRGFSDFASALRSNLQQVAQDAGATAVGGKTAAEVSARKRDAYKLLSSLTGFRFDESANRMQRYPLRAGTPIFRIAGVEQEFNLWHAQPKEDGQPEATQAADTTVPFGAAS